MCFLWTQTKREPDSESVTYITSREPPRSEMHSNHERSESQNNNNEASNEVRKWENLIHVLILKILLQKKKLLHTLYPNQKGLPQLALCNCVYEVMKWENLNYVPIFKILLQHGLLEYQSILQQAMTIEKKNLLHTLYPNRTGLQMCFPKYSTTASSREIS